MFLIVGALCLVKFLGDESISGAEGEPLQLILTGKQGSSAIITSIFFFFVSIFDAVLAYLILLLACLKSKEVSSVIYDGIIPV
jgi:hypothetical protein